MLIGHEMIKIPESKQGKTKQYRKKNSLMEKEGTVTRKTKT